MRDFFGLLRDLIRWLILRLKLLSYKLHTLSAYLMIGLLTKLDKIFKNIWQLYTDYVQQPFINLQNRFLEFRIRKEKDLGVELEKANILLERETLDEEQRE